MDRRDAIGRVALLLGGTIIGAEFFVSGCKPNGVTTVPDLLTSENVAFLNEVAETILPATGTPGAKAANAGHLMAVMVQDCYLPVDQKIFVDGLAKLKDAKFMDLNANDRTALLTRLDIEQKAYTKTKKPDAPNHYFRMFKELSLLGYFTSEIGCKQALRYVPIPGHYDGDYPYKKGDKAWALS